MIVGLTGGIGSGKSAAAAQFAALGTPVIDVDVISHQLTAAGQPAVLAIARELGNDMLNADGSLNRAAVRSKVFEDAVARQQLEGILHPAIYEEAQRQLQEVGNTAPYCIIVVPLLFESERYQPLIDRSLLIDCEESVQIARTMQRSQMSEMEVKNIMAAQLSRETRRQLANDIISNNGSLDELQKNVIAFHQKYINPCIVSN
ncbi:dephospho-CoA kinase [Methylovorus glucosotrophus]|uniref:Dephospho-CoA kinase n=1 Tax=Methylovorus glucosotrophus (strain SIP3-4) TaxID=582744 RepID=C6X9D6_METGS|nr:dephospho-CoA kinase [Methylovorus glucosotrophus]ACT49756.1 dephospho-CoA kinase [Methylovorus glucosotrophus SIP3-4]